VKRKLIVGAVLIVAILAAFISSSRRGVGPDALRVFQVREPVGQQGFQLATGFVVFTNITAKNLAVQIVSIGEDREWAMTNFVTPATVIMLPHSVYEQGLAFPGPRPTGPWRFRLRVYTEVKGVERAFFAAEYFAMRLVGKPSGGTLGTRFKTRGTYYGHRTEIILDADR